MFKCESQRISYPSQRTTLSFTRISSCSKSATWQSSKPFNSSSNSNPISSPESHANATNPCITTLSILLYSKSNQHLFPQKQKRRMTPYQTKLFKQVPLFHQRNNSSNSSLSYRNRNKSRILNDKALPKRETSHSRSILRNPLQYPTVKEVLNQRVWASEDNDQDQILVNKAKKSKKAKMEISTARIATTKLTCQSWTWFSNQRSIPLLKNPMKIKKKPT